MAPLTNCATWCGRRKESASPRNAWTLIEGESSRYLCHGLGHGVSWMLDWPWEAAVFADLAEIPLGFSASFGEELEELTLTDYLNGWNNKPSLRHVYRL